MSTADRSLQDAAAVRKVANRLKRAQVSSRRSSPRWRAAASCRDVVTQLAAVSSTIDRAGFAIISTAMRECITDRSGPDAFDSTNEPADQLTVEELEKLFLTLA